MKTILKYILLSVLAILAGIGIWTIWSLWPMITVLISGSFH